MDIGHLLAYLVAERKGVKMMSIWDPAAGEKARCLSDGCNGSLVICCHFFSRCNGVSVAADSNVSWNFTAQESTVYSIEYSITIQLMEY